MSETAYRLYTEEDATETSRTLLELRDSIHNDESKPKEERQKIYKSINIALDAVGRMPVAKNR